MAALQQVKRKVEKDKVYRGGTREKETLKLKESVTAGLVHLLLLYRPSQKIHMPCLVA
ncbi:hypothetical protein MTR_7g093217 [Medicago truncatula]|uniref:Uncharacterized protein n=1 Tax=Medicago truncatula TaxID=3880 RepID=A0A072U1T3_MEDTR|nr:hypothetical protein MTR_7g093217 [Medicago truncatula]